MNTSDKSRYIQIGLKIAYYRKLHEWTQEQLAEKIDCSPGYLSQVETPSFVQPVSLRLLFRLADAFEIPPYKLLKFEEADMKFDA